MAVTNDWGQAAKNSTNGFGKLATNTINEGAIYENSWSGDTALIGTSAAFAYGKSSYNQGEADPTPTITGTAGGTFNADAGVVFVDTGSFNSSTGQIDLSATTIDSHTITYTVDGVQSGQTVGVTAAPFSNVYSFEFDGVDETFSTGLSLAYTAVPNATLSFWVKFDYTGVTTNSWFYPVGIDSNHPNGSPVRVFYNGTTSRILIQGQGGNSFSTTNLNDGNWHHIVQTIQYDTNGTIFNVYVDSVKEITDKLLYAHVPLTGDFVIGGLRTNFGFFKGNIDEVSVFNSVLSQTDINTIYGSGTPSSISSLTPLAWYRMGEEGTFSNPGGTGDWTLTDQGSGGNNATSNNMEEADRKTNTP